MDYPAQNLVDILKHEEENYQSSVKISEYGLEKLNIANI